MADDPISTQDGDADTRRYDRDLHLRIPEPWHTALTDAAREMGISLNALIRLICRQFLRNRYTDEEKEGLHERSSE